MANYYASAMPTNETSTYSSGDYLVCFLTPTNDRTFQPNAGFPTGFEMAIVNKGSYAITFDPAGLSFAVGGGGKGRYYFDGTSWQGRF